MTLFQLLLHVLLATFVNCLKRSSKFLKTKISPYAFPIGVCYPKQMGASVTSIRLTCEEDCDNGVCERRVVSWHYGPDNMKCEGDPLYTDVFSEADRASYPFNCYEDPELEGETVNEADYAQSYMVVRLSRGKWINSDGNRGNNDNSGNSGTINTDDESDDDGECVKDESYPVFKTFPAITNKCVLGWSGVGPGATPHWYIALCNENATYVERYDGYNCTGNQTDAYPIYIPNGCDKRKWNNQYWYTEVLECSHPDYTIGIGFRNGDNMIASIIFIFIIACCLMF